MMNKILGFFVFFLMGCNEKASNYLDFDIVVLKINAFPDSDIEVGFFREDTAFASNFEFIRHLNRGEPARKKWYSREEISQDDSIILSKEIVVTNSEMKHLIKMLNYVDFKLLAANRKRDGMLDGTLWSLEVISGKGFSSKISFREPNVLNMDEQVGKIRNICEYIFGLHNFKMTDVPK